MTFVPKDVALLPESTASHPDRWVAMNVFARTCLGVSGDVVQMLGALPTGASETGTHEYKCWDIERFSNEDGLLADPSRFRREAADWRELVLDKPALLKKLKAHFIVIDDEAAYRRRFQPKRNLLDGDRFGNFHQQHGRHMVLVKRVDPAAWWMQQKFTPDQLSVRSDTLYSAVQWMFLEKFAAERVRSGMEIVDLGCGTGIYANLMAKHGAHVLGVDPSEQYLAVAKANAAPGTRFEAMKIGEIGGLDAIPPGSVDMVFMSDALLFYFVPFYPGQKADIQPLMGDIRRMLKPDGVFVSLELARGVLPHALARRARSSVHDRDRIPAQMVRGGAAHVPADQCVHQRRVRGNCHAGDRSVRRFHQGRSAWLLFRARVSALAAARIEAIRMMGRAGAIRAAERRTISLEARPCECCGGEDLEPLWKYELETRTRNGRFVFNVNNVI